MEEKEKTNRANFANYLSNPRGFTLKRWFHEMLGNKYGNYEKTIERLGVTMQTEDDLKDFGSLITAVFEAGFMKSLNEYREQIEKLGLKIHVVAESSRNSDSTQT